MCIRDRIERMIIDRRVTETIIQEFIMSTADVLLIVVDALTYSDQKLIEKILKSLNIVNSDSDGIQKMIFVIHNYSQLTDKEDVEKYIRKDIEGCFDVKYLWILPLVDPYVMNNRYWIQEKDKARILHFVMAREGTTAGNYFNPSTYDFVLQRIKAHPNRKVFNPAQEFKTYLNQNCRKYIKMPVDKLEYGEELITVRTLDNGTQVITGSVSYTHLTLPTIYSV
eukprot:TRINITY_DN13722_c0_g2_i2.p1 TRINITY_DN13722_c0_g2~~TRINITY_DN13722_c0_g2_i2.p1  ORF type:complete len:224 (+),score=42.33 TRINITY_DN13722_c0_g2_i2:65-736(+)